VRIIAFAAIGAVFGFAIGCLGKCATGSCPLIGNPIVSTITGALIGALIAAGK